MNSSRPIVRLVLGNSHEVVDTTPFRLCSGVDFVFSRLVFHYLSLAFLRPLSPHFLALSPRPQSWFHSDSILILIRATACWLPCSPRVASSRPAVEQP